MPMILVTGATGFVGSHVARELIRRKKQVLLVSRSGRFDADLKRGAQTLKLDITKPGALKRLPGPIEAVFHLAIHASGKPESDADFRQCIETNALGTLNLLELCRDRGIQRFIYSTSIGAYGRELKSPIGEDHPILPETAYGMGKRTGELFCERFHERYGIRHFILRYSSVYGYNQEPGTVLPLFIQRVRSGQDIVIFGAGKKKQDFVYIKDVVRANMLALRSRHPGYYQIGSGTGTSMFTLARTVRKVFMEPGRSMKVLRNPEIPEDHTQVCMNISRAREFLKYEPQFDLEAGLKDYKKHLPALS